jgi:hypothetical protein
MDSYVASGRYARDRAEQGSINRKLALNRNDAIRDLAKSDRLEDKILAILAAWDWYGFQPNDHGVLSFDTGCMGEVMSKNQAHSIVRYLETGEFPQIYNPGQPGASF